MELTIKRSEWLHGEGGYTSYLRRNADGKKCCLGFLATACGYTADEITGVKTIAVLGRKEHPLPEILKGFVVENTGAVFHIYANSDFANDLMMTNDAGHFTEGYREKELTRDFKKAGIDVTFVD